jgi:hypothetical protein
MSMTPSERPPVAPAGSRFDPVTGADLRAGGAQRRDSFALQPGEPVNSFNVVTSLMPLASGTAPQTYRWAIGLGVLVPVVAAALGYLAFAFVAAAVVVPVVYIVYMYDVNEWEDQPIGVVLGAVGLAAALGLGFTFLWHAGLLGDRTTTSVAAGDHAGVDWTSLLVLVLLVPVVSEILKQVGPLLLASRVQFDDMIDAVTFGVAAGASFAAAETIVVNRALFSSFGSMDNVDAGFWVSLILSAAVVKPIVYGAATGIALAAWSGVGAGYRGLTPAYARGVGEALLANIVFQAGLYLSSRVDGTAGAVLGLVWGALVAAAVVVRLRYLLHFALLEAALEASQTGSQLKDAARGTAYCPSCDMPLLAGAHFCVVCGTSTSSGSKITRRRNRTDDVLDAPQTLTTAAPGVVPRDNKRSALVLGAVLATVLVAGAIGQGAAAASSDADQLPDGGGIEVTPEVGSGPTTEPAPSPAPAPGPTPDPTVSPQSESSSQSKSTQPGLDGVIDNAAFVQQAVDSGVVRADGTGEPSGDESDAGGIGTPEGGGQAVDIGAGVGFTIPADWELVATDDGFAMVATPGGTFSVQRVDGPADVNALVAAHVQAIANGGLQDMRYSDPESLPLPSSSLVEFARIFYTGVYASQQSGTVPVDGVAFYLVTQDGTGYIADARVAQGLLDEGSPLLPALESMLNEFIGSVALS